jgi:Protein of unknown function (DUF1573)
MSSKKRRLKVKSLASRAQGTRPAGTGGFGKKMTWTLVVLAGAVVLYAAFGPKRKTEPSPSTSTTPPPKPTPPAQASKPPPPVDGPRIQFATRDYDFGKAVGDDQVNCLFVFTNTGIATLEVKEVSPGCGCMKAGEWTRKVEPGQTGTIPIRFDSRGFTGGFAKSVFVTCNDPTDAKPMLQIKGTVWRPLEITPPSAVLHLSAETPSNATSVRIISHMDEPVTVSDLSTTSKGLAVGLQTNQPGKEFQININTLLPWPTNSQQAQITFRTSVSNMPLVNLPLFVNLQAVVVAIPAQLRLPPPPQTNSFSSSVTIRNNGTNVLALSEAAVNAPGVTTTITEDPLNRQSTVAVAFPAGFEITPAEKVELRIKSNHPQFPVITVPISQLPRANSATASGPTLK